MVRQWEWYGQAIGAKFLKPRFKYRQTGFTLIELLMAVAVLEILIAIGSASYSDSTKKAKWTENITIANAVAKQAMTCLQIYGSSCSGVTGSVTPQDVGLTVWPKGRYADEVDLFFAESDGGFHVVVVGSFEAGGYRYDRGYSKLPDDQGYATTQSWRDGVPEEIMKPWPQDGF